MSFFLLLSRTQLYHFENTLLLQDLHVKNGVVI